MKPLKSTVMKDVRGTTLYEGGHFWSVAVGRNVFLNAQKDNDYTWSVVTVISEDGGNDIVCYFVFPTLRVAVALRHGELLAFNSQVEHCVSARCNGSREGFCISLYVAGEVGSRNIRNIEGGVQEDDLQMAEFVDKVAVQYWGSALT